MLLFHVLIYVACFVRRSIILLFIVGVFLSVNYVECYCILSYGFLKNEGDVSSS